MSKDMFDGFQPAEYEEEARKRWGGSPEFEESMRRAKRYTKEDWAAIQQEGNEITQGVAALMDRDPVDPEVQRWIRKHHEMINDRFYTCPLAVYRGLGDLYVQDQRFTANYDRVKPGLAAFMRAAMHAYCDKAESQAR
ncbi:MAG: TipAS antibiotic-recognition domain-containing protein [Bacillota bacterium]